MFLTLDEIKEYLGITGTEDDDLLTLIGEGVCSFIEKYTCTIYGRTETFTEVLDGKGTDTVISNNFPITITTLEIRNSAYNENNWATIDSKEYMTLDEGMVRYMVGTFAERTGSVRLTGTYGYADVPDDIKLIALMMTKNKKSEGAGSTTKETTSETIGDYKVEYSDVSSMNESGRIYDILNDYKVC
jgi:hypothetical protein